MSNGNGRILRWLAAAAVAALAVALAVGCLAQRTPTPDPVIVVSDPLPAPTPRPALHPPPAPAPHDYTAEAYAYAAACANLTELLQPSAAALLASPATTWGDAVALGELTLDTLSALNPPPALYQYHSAVVGAVSALRDRAVAQPADGAMAVEFAAYLEVSPGAAAERLPAFLGVGFEQGLAVQQQAREALPADLAQLMRDADCAVGVR